jgi:hypothetical protein
VCSICVAAVENLRTFNQRRDATWRDVTHVGIFTIRNYLCSQRAEASFWIRPLVRYF